MKLSIIPSPCGEDVMLRINEIPGQVIHRIVLTTAELQELKVAIEKFQQEQPFRVAKNATGGKK